MNRRIRAFNFGTEYLVEIFQPGNVLELRRPDGKVNRVRVLSGIPADAKVLSAHADYFRQGIYLLVEHDSFDEVKDGEYYPNDIGPVMEHIPDDPEPVTIGV